MKKATTLFMVLIALFSGACRNGSKTGKKEGFLIEGKIENGKGAMISLGRISLKGAEIIATDTADLSGNFRLEGYAREKFVAILNFDGNKRIFLVVDTNSRMQLDIPADYDRYTVSGSEESEEFMRLRDIEIRSGKELAEVRRQAESFTEENEADMLRLREMFTEITDRYNRELTDSFKSSSSVLIPLFFYFNLQLPFDAEMKKSLYERAEQSGLRNDIVETYMRQYKAELSTAIGKEAPVIVLQDSSGIPFSLADMKGKVVLIDFWASWCAPCRMENPNVVQVYRKFKDKGFEILGVSLDNDRYKWVEAIHKDNIHWKHVSDLKGWQSSAARLYAVSSIPATFLVDREGKIIARNLRGEALERKIAEVLAGESLNN